MENSFSIQLCTQVEASEAHSKTEEEQAQGSKPGLSPLKQWNNMYG